MRKTVKLIGAVILCALLFATLSISALANSAVVDYEDDGAEATAIIVADENTPLTVEKELLTLDIEELPKSRYRYSEEAKNFKSAVTAEYTIYNPTEKDVTARLLFPFGSTPDYIDRETVCELITKDERFGITFNGAKAATDIRHSYSPYVFYGEFDTEKELSKLSDSYIDDGFYFANQTVTKYIFEVTEANFDWDNMTEVVFNINDKSGKRAYYFPEQSGYYEKSDGSAEVSVWVDEIGQQIAIYVLGEPLDQGLSGRFYVGMKKSSGKLVPLSPEQTTLEEFLLRGWSEASGVSKVDWFNAMVASSKESAIGLSQPVTDVDYEGLWFEEDLMQWYDYMITVPAGARVVNTVCAPIFPSINEGYTPPIYEYTYLLSPAESWKEFGELEIVINTPHYLALKSSVAFSKTDGGYTVKLSGLPDKELTFILSSSPNPESPTSFFEDLFSADNLLIALPIIGVVGLLIGGIVVVIVAKSRNKEGKNK